MPTTNSNRHCRVEPHGLHLSAMLGAQFMQEALSLESSGQEGSTLMQMKRKRVFDCRDGSMEELETVDITPPEAIEALLATHKTGSTFYR